MKVLLNDNVNKELIEFLLKAIKLENLLLRYNSMYFMIILGVVF